MNLKQAKESWRKLLTQIPDAQVSQHDKYAARVAFDNGYEFEFRIERIQGKFLSPWLIKVAYLLKEPDELKDLDLEIAKSAKQGKVGGWPSASSKGFLTAAGYKIEYRYVGKGLEDEAYLTTEIHHPLQTGRMDDELQLTVLLGDAYLADRIYQYKRHLGRKPSKPKQGLASFWYFSDWYWYYLSYWHKNVYSKKTDETKP